MLHHISEALVTFGPLGVFLLAVLDSAGVPLPATMDFLLIFVAIKSPDKAYFTALMAVLGSVGGNLGLFLAARYGGRRFVKVPEPGKPQRFRKWFNRYGLLTVFIPAVLPVPPLPLKVFVVSAGVLHTPLVQFLGVVVLSRCIRYFGEAYLGIRLGQDAPAFLTRNGWTLAGAALALTLVLVAIIRFYARRDEAAERYNS